MNVAARVCRSPDSWPWTDHAQISLIHSPTPPKCSTRVIMALINNLGIVYHQYCSSSATLLEPPVPASLPSRVGRSPRSSSLHASKPSQSDAASAAPARAHLVGGWAHGASAAVAAAVMHQSPHRRPVLDPPLLLGPPLPVLGGIAGQKWREGSGVVVVLCTLWCVLVNKNDDSTVSILLHHILPLLQWWNKHLQPRSHWNGHGPNTRPPPPPRPPHIPTTNNSQCHWLDPLLSYLPPHLPFPNRPSCTPIQLHTTHHHKHTNT